jgi:hypothetical protein
MGVNEEGRLVRSRFNPNYFKNIDTGSWYELNLKVSDAGLPVEKGMLDREQLPGGVDNPLPGDRNTSEDSGEESNKYNLSEEEKQRLAKLLSDVEVNGGGMYHMVGTLAGFVGDNNFESLPTSSTDRADYQAGFREGEIARGGKR